MSSCHQRRHNLRKVGGCLGLSSLFFISHVPREIFPARWKFHLPELFRNKMCHVTRCVLHSCGAALSTRLQLLWRNMSEWTRSSPPPKETKALTRHNPYRHFTTCRMRDPRCISSSLIFSPHAIATSVTYGAFFEKPSITCHCDNYAVLSCAVFL